MQMFINNNGRLLLKLIKSIILKHFQKNVKYIQEKIKIKNYINEYLENSESDSDSNNERESDVDNEE